MGKWDKEVIDLLPKTVKVYASAGAGYDWVDIQALADKGTLDRTHITDHVPTCLFWNLCDRATTSMYCEVEVKRTDIHG